MHLIIFDLDGTLFNSETSVLLGVQDALKAVGLPPSRDDFILSLMGENTENFCTKLLSSYGKKGMDTYRDFLKALWVSEAKQIESNGELFDGVPEVLEELSHMGHKLAVCSNATKEYIGHVLKTQGIAQYFDYTKSADEMKNKTHGIKELLASTEHSEAVMVGDRIHDLEAAAANSIHFIGALYGYGGDEVRDAEYVAEMPTDIILFVDEI